MASVMLAQPEMHRDCRRWQPRQIVMRPSSVICCLQKEKVCLHAGNHLNPHSLWKHITLSYAQWQLRLKSNQYMTFQYINVQPKQLVRSNSEEIRQMKKSWKRARKEKLKKAKKKTGTRWDEFLSCEMRRRPSRKNPFFLLENRYIHRKIHGLSE